MSELYFYYPALFCNDSIYFLFVLEEGCLLCSSFQMFLPIFPLLMCVCRGISSSRLSVNFGALGGRFCYLQYKDE